MVLQNAYQTYLISGLSFSARFFCPPLQSHLKRLKDTTMKALMNWSGGKDSALALYLLQQQNTPPLTLFTTLNKAFQRISMHGVRLPLLQAQAQALNLPLKIVDIPEQVSMEQYNQLMQQALIPFKEQGITHSVFGDIFLEDLKAYREEQLAKLGLEAHFPLWGKPTSQVMKEFLQLGFKTLVVAANAKLLDKSFVGRVIDKQFLEDLPEHVDPCGENGEFHTFVFDGPNFSHPIPFQVGETVLKTYKHSQEVAWDNQFWFCDLLPET